MSIRRCCSILTLAFLLGGALSLPGTIAPSAAYAAEETWKTEFEQVCGQTDNAMEMSIAELSKALERCDLLKPQIEQLEATPRKVYLKRLQMCRNLFAYMLESKKKTPQQQ